MTARRCRATNCPDCGATFCHRNATSTVVRPADDDPFATEIRFDYCQHHLDKHVESLEAWPFPTPYRVEEPETA